MSTAPFVESFFDDNFQKTGGLNFKLWIKPTVLPAPKDVVFEGFLYKTGKKANNYQLRFYRMTSSHLYYYKVSSPAASPTPPSS